MNKRVSYKFRLNLFIPAGGTIILFVFVSFFVIIPRFEKNMVVQKKDKIKQITVSFCGVLEQLNTQVSDSLKTKEEAQNEAILLIDNVKYGDEKKDYFWATDMYPTMIVHPYRKDLRNKELKSFKDPNGKKLFVESVKTVKESGQGFIYYMWQWKDDSTKIVPKLSFVKEFEPWGWIIGTGIYLNDVKAETKALTYNLMLILVGISILIAGLFFFIVRKGVSAERKRLHSEKIIIAQNNSLKKKEAQLERTNNKLFFQNEEYAKLNKELKNSKEKFKKLSNLTFEGIIIHNNGIAIDVNLSLEKMFGYTAEELIGVNLIKLLVPEKHHNIIIENINRNQIRPYELEGRRKDGTIFPIEMEARNIQIDPNGREERVAAIRDISLRKKAETALLKSELRFKNLFEKSKEAFLIMENGRFTDCNQATLDMLLYKNKSEIQFKLPHELSSKVQGDGQASSKKANYLIQEAIKEGACKFEWSLIKSNGETFPVEILLTAISNEPENQIIYVSTRDISERKKNETQLKKYQRELESLVREQTNELRVANEELNATIEELETTNGRLFSQKEELENTLTKLQNAQAQLIQAEKMSSLGILTAGLAHEINNPINFISTGISGLQTVFEDITECINNVNNDNNEMISNANILISGIQIGVDRTIEIIRSLNSYIQAKDNKTENIDIRENIDNTLLILNNQLKHKIEIFKNYEEIPLIECYPGKINQVFMNIIVNAIQSIKDTGTITITTSKKSNTEIIISIKDTGCGIPDDIQRKIFDPFFTTKEVGKGTGLGLSIVYEIVKQHNGNISVYSQVEKGTEFVINLPIKQS